MAEFNATRYLKTVFPGLARDGNGDIQVTSKQTIGRTPNPTASSRSVDANFNKRIRTLKDAADKNRELGRELEANLLLNQADFERKANELRNQDFGPRYEELKQEMAELAEKARGLDKQLIDRELADRETWSEERRASEAKHDLEDDNRRLLAKEYTDNFNKNGVQARLDEAYKTGRPLDQDVVEMIDTRLARSDDGLLKSTYQENSLRGKYRLTQELYAKELDAEAQRATDPAVRARYERQAGFERETATLSQGQSSEITTRLQIDQAQQDLSLSSSFKDSAQHRISFGAQDLAAHTAKERDRFSPFRSALEPSQQKKFDRSVDAFHAYQKQHKGDDYKLTSDDFRYAEQKFTEAQSKAASQRGEQRVASTRSLEVNSGSINQADAGRQGNRHELKPIEIKGYKANWTEDKRGIEYMNNSTTSRAFTDEGAKIRMSPKTASNEASRANDMRAALMLASTKYDRISIGGSTEFREQSAKIAAELGLAERIANPELKAVATKEADRLKTTQTSELVRSDAKQAETRPLTAELKSEVELKEENLRKLSQEDTLPRVGIKNQDANLATDSKLDATMKSTVKVEDVADELPRVKRRSDEHAATQGDVLPRVKRRNAADRPESQTATATATSSDELPSVRSSNARQSLQSLDASQAASDDLPKAQSDDIVSDASVQQSSSMSRSR